MSSLLFVSTIPVLIARFVGGQMPSNVPLAVCTVAAANWTFNDKRQSPCEVANTLIGQCLSTPGPFITQLEPGNVYVQPTVFDSCSCSTVTYSLISACAICQGGNISFWAGIDPSWSQNCTSDIITDGSYPLNIPPNTSIPVWAYQSISDFFNPVIADGIAAEHGPDSSFVSSTVPATDAHQSTATTTTTTTPQTSTSKSTEPSATSKSGRDLNTAVLAGAVAGAVAGVVCLCLAISGCVCYYRKKQKDPKRYFEGLYRAPEPESNLEFPFSGSTMPTGLHAPYRLYDPADPSTYPPPSALNLGSMSPNLHTSPSLPDVNLISPTSTTSSTGRTIGNKHTRQYSSESDSTYTGRHTRQYSSETDSTYPQTTSSHSRQSSTDTSSISTKSLVSPVSSSRSRNFMSGYHPSGIVYRTIREDPS